MIEEGRRYWGFPAHADLRLCKADSGHAYESWTKVAEFSARPEVELVLVVR